MKEIKDEKTLKVMFPIGCRVVCINNDNQIDSLVVGALYTVIEHRIRNHGVYVVVSNGTDSGWDPSRFKLSVSHLFEEDV